MSRGSLFTSQLRVPENRDSKRIGDAEIVRMAHPLHSRLTAPGRKGGLAMPKKNINLNDFTFDLVVRVDARNCRQLVIRLIAGIAALAVIAERFAMWLATHAQ